MPMTHSNGTFTFCYTLHFKWPSDPDTLQMTQIMYESLQWAIVQVFMHVQHRAYSRPRISNISIGYSNGTLDIQNCAVLHFQMAQ